MVLRTTGPKSSVGPLFENSLLPKRFFKLFFIEIDMHHSCVLHFSIQTAHIGKL